MKISETKKLLRDMCRIMGHDYVFKSPKGHYVTTRCSRCKKRFELVAWERVGMVIHNVTGVSKIILDP